MEEFAQKFNDLLVDVYRCILQVEEKMLQSAKDFNLSINEMHMVEAVGRGENHCRTISGLAEDMNITLPSVTVAINKLLKKGYVEKVRGEEDGRNVYVSLTKSGRKINAMHQYFHTSMVHSVLTDMTEEERQALLQGVLKLDSFLKGKISLLDENSLLQK